MAYKTTKKKKDEELTDYERAIKRHNEASFNTIAPPNVQKLDPAFDTKSQKSSYTWESDLLKPLSIKSYGRSYNDKFDTFTKRAGVSPTEGQEFRRWLDAGEKMETNNKYTSETLRETVNNTKKIQQNKSLLTASKKPLPLIPLVQKSKKKKDESFLADLKNFLSGKDTDGDGQRNGLLGALDRFVLPISQGADEFLIPGNNERMIQNDLLKDGKIDNPVNKASLVDRGTETKVLQGVGTLLAALTPYDKAYKVADYGFNKLPKLANAVTNPYVQKAIKGALAGGMAESGLSVVNELANSEANDMKDYALRTGLGVAGGAILDPALYGVGQGLRKGVETATSRTMENLLPDKKEAAKRLSQILKEYHQEQAPLPGKQDLRGAKELIPSGNDITDPNFIPSLNPKPSTNPVIPKIGNRLENIPPIEDLSLAERAQLVEGNRPTPDFSTAKPVIEPADKVNVYGVEAPKGDLVDTTPPEYWQKRYEDFTKYVKDNGYNENNLNHEAIQELWTHFARADEPPLSTVVDLAYKGYKEPKVINAADVWDQMGNRPPVSKNAKDILLGNSKPKPKSLPPTPEVKPIQVQPQPNLMETLKSLGASNKPKETQMGSNKDLISAEQVINNKKTKELPPMKPNESLPYVNGERKHYSTLANSEKAPDEFIDGIKNLDRKITHSLSDKDAAEFANGLINRDIEEAVQFVKNAEIRDKRHTVTGFRLLDEFNKQGNYERAVDMADILAKEGTKFGQGLQSFSVYNRLSVEGQIIRAQRIVMRTNESLPANKQIVLTPEITHDIAAAADSIQKLTGQQELGKNVISLLEQAKKGKSLTDEELKVVGSFMQDVKKFVGDVDPKAKAPKLKTPKDTRTRDNVIDFMSKQEAAAKKRIEMRRNRANSLPLDALYDYGVVGASKIAKGTVKFADFSEQMIKEHGPEIKPYMQQIWNKASEFFNLQTEKITASRVSQAEKLVNKAIIDKTLSQTEADELLALTKQLVNATGDSKIAASMDLQVVLNQLEQPTFAQMASSAYYQSLLLNPLTIIRNILGNEMFYRVERVSKLVTAPMDAITSKITGNQRTIAFNSGQFNWKNFFNPTKDFGKGFKTGAIAGYKGVNPLGINTAYDIKSPAFSSKSQNLGFVKKMLVSKVNPLHWTEKALGVTMRSFDTAGYMRAYNSSLREQATLKAMNEGLKGKALREAAEQYFRQADENMLAIAEEYGKYATFQDNTALARGMTKLKEKGNEVSTNVLSLGMAKTKEFGLGSAIIPFPKTPANLVMRAIEYSPAGVIRSVGLLREYFKVGKNPLMIREAQMAFGRAIVGTGGFSLFGYILADKGVLTSAGDSDYEVRELEKMAGKQPNSVNVSAVKRFMDNGYNLKDLELKNGDSFVSYDWAQPLSIAMALGTGINQAYKESEDPTTSDKVVGALDSAANTILNMSSLSSLNKLLSGPPGEPVSEKLAGSLSGFGGSYIPTLSNQVRKLTDNQTRSTYDPTFKEQFINAAINRIPGKEKKLPPSYNTLGDKKELYQGGTNNILNIFANPAFKSKYKPTPEAKFLLDYMNKTGDKSLVPRIPDKKLDGVKLTGKQYSELQRIMGSEVKKGVKDLIPQFQGSDDTEAIADELKDILRDAGKTARAEIRSKMVSREQLDEAYKKYGLSESTIYERIDKGKSMKWALTTPE